jgi:phosphoribosylformylglycinamidine cyclo-ligase
MPKQGYTYKDAGVNIDLGDDVSKILYNAAKQTWNNRKGKLGELVVPFDDFSGVRAIDVSNLPSGTLMNIGFDGVGTKMELAERVKNHRTIAFDLFAMVCDDAVVRGAEPVLVGSILDANSLGTTDKPFIEEVRQLAEGYINAAKAANVAIVNGEVAELGSRVGGYGSNGFIENLAHYYISVNLNKDNWENIRLLSIYLIEEDKDIKKSLFEKLDEPEKDFISAAEKMKTLNYNWGAGVVWFARKDRMFTGREIKEGDYLVGLREEGFRSNGLSLVRKIMKHHHGDNWHKISWKRGGSLADLALTPSKIYTAAVVDMFGGYAGEPKTEIHGVAHITGGGIPGKLGRVLKHSGLGAIIDSPFEPSQFMAYTQALGNVSDVEAYKTWNMGQGMIVITPKPDEVIKIADKYMIPAQCIGRVAKEPKIRIKNRGAFCPDKNPEGGFYKRGDAELVF